MANREQRGNKEKKKPKQDKKKGGGPASFTGQMQGAKPGIAPAPIKK